MSSYILFCLFTILCNRKFILVATSLGTNVVVVMRVHRIRAFNKRYTPKRKNLLPANSLGNKNLWTLLSKQITQKRTKISFIEIFRKRPLCQCEQWRSRWACATGQSDLDILCSPTYTTVFSGSVSGQRRPDQPAQMRRQICPCVVRKLHKGPFHAFHII